MNENNVYVEIECPNGKRRAKRYEIKNEYAVCPACGQTKGHKVTVYRGDEIEVHEMTE